MNQQKNTSSCFALDRVLGLTQCKTPSSFSFFIFLKNHGSQFHFVFLIINFKDKKNDFTRTSQKNYSFELSSVTLSLCPSLRCETDPFLLTSVLPGSPCSTSPSFCPFTNAFTLCCLKSLDFLVLP